jgi:transcriptional regulator with XRE-family HTH domain
MQLKEIKYRNLLRLCRENKCEEPSKLAVLLGSKIQHAQQLLKGRSSIGNKTIAKLCNAWKISPEEFIRIDSESPEKTQPASTSQGNDLILSVIAGRLHDLADRIKAQGNAKDVRRLKKVG